LRLLWLLLIALAERLAAGCASGIGLRVWLICGGKERGRGRLLAELTLGRAAWRRGCRRAAKAAACANKKKSCSQVGTLDVRSQHGHQPLAAAADP
jgi:hypothetical protein